eukprot:8883479-Pyramimonas_sp.AAC.1
MCIRDRACGRGTPSAWRCWAPPGLGPPLLSSSRGSVGRPGAPSSRGASGAVPGAVGLDKKPEEARQGDEAAGRAQHHHPRGR